MGYEIKNICTLVPNPYHPEFYKNKDTPFYYFSLFITPRLQFDGKLKEFWEMLNWPDYVEEVFWKSNNNFLENVQLETNHQSKINIQKDFTFYKELGNQMDIGDGTEFTDDIIKDFLDKGKSVWKTLFKEDTPVEAWPIYLKPQPISAAPKAETQPPPPASPTSTGTGSTTVQTNRRATLPTDVSSKQKQENKAKRILAEKFEATKYKEEFHKKISALSRYPHVLRVLGLIHDFKVPKKDIDDLPGLSKGNFLLRFHFRLITDSNKKNIAQEFNQSVQFVRPFTRCELNVQLSAYADEVTLTNGSKVRYKDIVDSGFISNKYFEVSQNYFEDRSGEFTDSKTPAAGDSNVIGISGKSFTDEEIRILRQKTNPQPKISKGFAIKIKAQPGDLLTTMDQRLEQITDDNIESDKKAFEAHHLDCGYRVDVCLDNKANEFWSLCRRRANYIIDDDNWFNKILGNTLFKELEDEPWLEEVRQVDNDGNSNRFEDISRWNGWSLTCPQLNAKSETNNISQDMELKAIKPLLLPKLRFGEKHQYQFRIRTVDICGNGPLYYYKKDKIDLANGVTPDIPDDTLSIPKSYNRYEPINPPLFFPQKDLIKNLSERDNSKKSIVKEFLGEENETMVIRTKVNYNDKGEAEKKQIESECIRFLAPQYVTAHFAELSGQFEMIDKSKSLWLYKFLQEIPKHSYNNSELKDGVPFAVDSLVEKCVVEDGDKNLYYFHFEKVPNTPKVKPITLALKNDGLNGSISLKAGEYKQLTIASIERGKNLEGRSAKKIFNIIHAVQRPVLKSGKAVDDKKLKDFFKFERMHPLSNPAIDYRDEQKYQVQLKMDEESLKDVPDVFPFETTNELIISVEYNNYELNPFNKNGWSYISKDNPKETNHKSNSSTNESSKADRFYIRKSWNNLDEATEEDKLDTVLKDDAYTERLKDDYFNLLDHSFPDTKYREVKYTIEGVSKYSSFFDIDAHDIDKKDSSPFSLKKSFNTIIENSSKPSKPNLTAILPVFTIKEKEGNFEFNHDTFRIYLGDTWYETGLNEKLAVIFRKHNLTTEIPDERNKITVLANDPTTDSTVIYPDSSNKYFSNVKGDTIVNNKLFNLTIDSINIMSKSKPEELNNLVNNNQHDWAELEVKWDNEQKLFYADVQFKTDEINHYSSMIKFAVCRYQEHSINLKEKYDYRFSDVVMTDMVTVLPTRTVVKTLGKENEYKLSGNVVGSRYSAPDIKIKNKIYRISELNKIDEEVSYLTEAKFDIKEVLDNDFKLPENGKAHFIEEYEDIRVNAEFEMDEKPKEGFTKDGYNPRHDPSKRLVFFYKIGSHK